MNLLIEIALETVIESIWFLSPSEKELEGIRNLKKWRNGELSSHDETMIDSNSSYILLATGDGLFLVHRKKSWKGKLDNTAESLYSKKGRRAFRRIHNQIQKTNCEQ